jgi:Na+/H+ antiporter NhaD/arsenite permease-like protein
VFFVFDSLAYQKWLRERRPHLVQEAKFEVLGKQNFFFLVIILTAVFAPTPVRETIMISAAAASFRFARKDALEANGFNFHPIQEVAFLFAGIFITMVPALDWLSMNAPSLGITTPGQFYWAAGILSSFLDNAPTYLTFLAAALGLNQLTLGNSSDMKIFLDSHGRFLEAISIAAVFFGASTYIGNGPNFMVKAIAERVGVPCPSFLAYIVKYSIPVLIPIFALIWFLFFRQAT